MNRENANVVAIRTTVFGVLILALGFVSSRNDLVVGILGTDISFTILPLIIASTIIYADAIADVFLKGELSQAVSRGVVGFAVGLFLSMVIMSAPGLQNYQVLSFWILIATVIMVAANIFGALSRSYHVSFLRILSISIALLMLGYVSSQIITFLSQHATVQFPPSSGIVIFCGFAAASALCLLGLLSGSRNPYLSYVGKKFSNTPSLIAVLGIVTFLFFYSFDLRPILAVTYSAYLLPFEWGAVLLISYALYRDAKSYVATSLAEDLSLGMWTRLFQKIVQKKDEVEEVSKIVKKFVDEGNKEGVLVYLTSTLFENQASASETEAAISKIVKYQDIPSIKLTFLSKLENREQENKVRRKKVLHQALVDTAGVLRLHVPAARWVEAQTVEGLA
jgi:hypothetical protein